ncbi:hypothetical protein GQ44DRAFT_785563 [Phaeosphaeriaceae sp. PMI808]|nr:hypothetical protein GQ44DRAFT_785563 [Phaeosphaeriaceae sp. PMI808]
MWGAQIHLWIENHEAKIEWELIDPNGNQAGQGNMKPQQGNEAIAIYIESMNRPIEHMMPFGVKAWFENPTNIDEARVQFEIQKAVQHCNKTKQVPCKPSMRTENKLETKSFLVDTCFQYCESSADWKILPHEMNCEDMSEANWLRNGNAWKRDFVCYWRGF